ncbi:MAG TPA: adenosylcobinamide-GDP ribazoletransferase [Nocardioidaceae bacterium]|nr:adenosylcobinamide-GDP ribazoletransferase [Nocardioidaceae bacterium]
MRGGAGDHAVSPSSGAVTNALRLALGTLTVIPTPPPSQVDRRTGSWAMTLAPLVGAALAVLVGLFLGLVGRAGAGVGPATAAVLAIGLLAVLTRAMHLDGLADTADGLGSGKPADQALEIMRRGDVGPFGVVTLVLVLLVQVFALAELVAAGLGFPALLLALVVSRLALPLLCSRGVPAARPDGLGQVVAGSVSRGRLAIAVLVSAGALMPLSLVSPGWDALGSGVVVRAGVVAGLALLAAWLLGRRAVRRLGGVTGDVLGAGVEVAFTVALVTLTLLT